MNQGSAYLTVLLAGLAEVIAARFVTVAVWLPTIDDLIRWLPFAIAGLLLDTLIAGVSAAGTVATTLIVAATTGLRRKPLFRSRVALALTFALVESLLGAATFAALPASPDTTPTVWYWLIPPLVAAPYIVWPGFPWRDGARRRAEIRETAASKSQIYRSAGAVAGLDAGSHSTEVGR